VKKDVPKVPDSKLKKYKNTFKSIIRANQKNFLPMALTPKQVAAEEKRERERQEGLLG